MTKCFCDICKKEILKDGKHYALAVRSNVPTQYVSETQLYLEDVCYDCYTDFEKYLKKRGYYHGEKMVE